MLLRLGHILHPPIVRVGGSQEKELCLLQKYFWSSTFLIKMDPSKRNCCYSRKPHTCPTDSSQTTDCSSPQSRGTCTSAQELPTERTIPFLAPELPCPSTAGLSSIGSFKQPGKTIASRQGKLHSWCLGPLYTTEMQVAKDRNCFSMFFSISLLLPLSAYAFANSDLAAASLVFDGYNHDDTGKVHHSHFLPKSFYWLCSQTQQLLPLQSRHRLFAKMGKCSLQSR